ncbi:sensor histidine kinase [Parasphingorhabdus cellanae]|uniref:histidine kinase n=1 Tax=Parasphingorhabdus cellanae TaxID=2806553 RepID=A0ABX7T3D4_9SPHN|nr:HAMP domain-containing sensor histidine kinase [Parasphingorhabdus cellanae]QTD56078.1 HAMP domain-containing histidine kinase [Parasphingorhabdus cellanae]
MTVPGNLAEPVRGLLDADGRLISADPPLLRLHLHCGGYEGGPLAVPQLLSLCRLSRQLDMNLSRSVQAADEDNLISMWVEIRLHRDEQKGVISINIVDWKESPAPSTNDAEPGRRRDFDRLNGRGSIRTDASLRIMALSLPGDLDAVENYIGHSLLDVLDFVEPSKQSVLVESISERQPVRGQHVRQRRGKKSYYVLSGQPLIDNEGLFSGYRFSLELDQDRLAEEDTDVARKSIGQGDLISDSLFGAQLGPALRQPLGKIIANAETIGSRLEGPLRGDYSDYAKDIASAGRHLMDLVNDLSDLEAIQRTSFSVAVDDIDLVDLAHRAAGLLAVKAADHQIRIDLPDKDLAMPVKGEFRRVLQILVNLIGNAIRYSPDGSVIKLQVADEGDVSSVTVRDQGDGIAEENHELIFEKFERLGRSGDGGSGLGLFISRRLANAMNGRLTVRSAVGKGSTFKLSLPTREV